MLLIAKTNDEKILVALLSTPTRKMAAKYAGVSEATVNRRLADPKFRERYDAERLGLLKQYTESLQFCIGGAVNTLYSVMSDKNNAAQTRINAASEIIRSSLKLTEQTDILTRLKALEDARNDQS